MLSDLCYPKLNSEGVLGFGCVDKVERWYKPTPQQTLNLVCEPSDDFVKIMKKAH